MSFETDKKPYIEFAPNDYCEDGNSIIYANKKGLLLLRDLIDEVLKNSVSTTSNKCIVKKDHERNSKYNEYIEINPSSREDFNL